MRSSSSRAGKIDAGGWIGGLAELERGDLFERLDQRAERFEILVVGERTVARQVLVHHRDGAAHVANFVRHRAHQNARGSQQLVEAELFAIAQIFGGVHHHGGQPRAHAGAVGGKPDIGQEGFAVLALAAALHDGAEDGPFVRAPGRSRATEDTGEWICRGAIRAIGRTDDARRRWLAAPYRRYRP
jgi:hypothetical protein